MAFPNVAATSNGENGVDSAGPYLSSFTVTFPAGVAVGDLLLVFIHYHEAWTTPAGWAQVFDGDLSSNVSNMRVIARIADGTEGASDVFSFATLGQASWVCYRYDGSAQSFDVSLIEVSSMAEGSGTSLDCPSLTPAAGAQDYSWIACGVWFTELYDIVGWPSNCAGDQVMNRGGSSASYGGGVCVATNDANASSFNPADGFTWQFGIPREWAGITLAVPFVLAFAPSSFGIEVGFVAGGPQVTVSEDVTLYPDPAFGIEVGFQAGLRFRTAGRRQLMLTGSGIETPEMTTGGTVGQAVVVTADGFGFADVSSTPATTVESETTWGITPAVGSDTEYARQDHTHGTPAEPSAGSLPWFDVTTYGATGDGSTDDTSSVNDAIAAFNTATRGVLYFPAGTYKVTDALTAITASGMVLGDGGSYSEPATQVNQTSASADLFTVTGDGLSFRGLSMTNTSAGATTSDGIVVTGGAHARYQDLNIRDFAVGLKLAGDSKYWTVESCYVQCDDYCFYIENTTNPDAGDWGIQNCLISAADANGVGIYIANSGGGRIIGNKINNADRADTVGIQVDIDGTESTVALLIVGNSIENVPTDAIRVTTSDTAMWSSIVIASNQLGLYNNTTGAGIVLNGASSGDIANVAIIGNSIHANSNAGAAIELTNVDDGAVIGNVVTGFGSVLSLTTCNDIEQGSSVTPASSVTDETTWGITPAVGTDTEYARQDHTHGSPAEPTASGGIGPLLISDDHSTPIVFGDLLLTEEGDDLLYADTGG